MTTEPLLRISKTSTVDPGLSFMRSVNSATIMKQIRKLKTITNKMHNTGYLFHVNDRPNIGVSFVFEIYDEATLVEYNLLK